jgi:hypothetical protein
MRGRTDEDGVGEGEGVDVLAVLVELEALPHERIDRPHDLRQREREEAQRLDRVTTTNNTHTYTHSHAHAHAQHARTTHTPHARTRTRTRTHNHGTQSHTPIERQSTRGGGGNKSRGAGCLADVGRDAVFDVERAELLELAHLAVEQPLEHQPTNEQTILDRLERMHAKTKTKKKNEDDDDDATY